mgnify:CR=1 FL=1
MEYDLEIAIPTYNRPDILGKKTLKLLEEVPKEYIKIYVEDEEQASLYSNYGEKDQLILTHTKGIGEKRNFIKQHSKSRWLMQIDDDLSDIVDFNGIALSSKKIFDIIIDGFKEAERQNLRLWGIAPFCNSFYLKNLSSNNLKFICGNFHGTINSNPIMTPINTFEDYYNTCMYFLEDGGVLRYNGFGTRTGFAKTKGGLQSFFEESKDRTNEEMINADILIGMFGKKMLRKVIKKRGVDLRLNHHFKLRN